MPAVADEPKDLWDLVSSVGRVAGLAIALIVALALTRRVLVLRGSKLAREHGFARQVIMLGLTVLALVILVIALPVEPTTRQQMLAVMALVLTVIITLSSTTFASNVMAGLMLRSVRNFKPGDFIRVGDMFGRVSERGLFHVEIQTEDRDLTTLPNQYLVTNPVTVLRSSGTIVSCTLSLGYDVPHTTIDDLLIEAANRAGLEEPFVRVVELGDFSVSYRVAGFLEDVKQVLSVRSSLRRHALDTLHGAGVEIVSPTFMNQRQLNPEDRFMAVARRGKKTDGEANDVDARIFDKADVAQRVQQLRDERATLAEEIKELEAELATADAGNKPAIERTLHRRQGRLEGIDTILDDAETELADQQKD